MPAADSASCELVTTSTLAGSAAAAFGRADAVAGTTRARLIRARPTLLLLIHLSLGPYVVRACISLWRSKARLVAGKRFPTSVQRTSRSLEFCGKICGTQR